MAEVQDEREIALAGMLMVGAAASRCLGRGPRRGRACRWRPWPSMTKQVDWTTRTMITRSIIIITTIVIAITSLIVISVIVIMTIAIAIIFRFSQK